MGFLSRIRDRFARNDSSSAVAGLFPKWQANRPLWGIGDYRLLADEGYRRNVVIYGCVRAISDSTAEPRVTVKQWKRDGTFEEVKPDHPLIALITEPNPDQSWFEYAEEFVTHQQVAGNAYLHKIRSKAGRVVQMRTLRPDRMKIVPDEWGHVLGYEFSYGGEGAKTTVPAEDVIQLKLPDPLDDFYGLSPIAVAAGIADMDTNSVDYLRAFFLNSGEPSGIIKIKGRTSPEERQRVKEMWREQHGMGARTAGWGDGFRRMFGGGGVGGWHSPTVMDEDVEYQEIGSRPGKLGLDNIFGITESRMCAAFGVPALVVGVKLGLEKSTYNNYETALKAFWSQTLRPMYSRIGDKLTMGLASEFGTGLKISFALESVQALQESQDARRNFAIAGWNSELLTKNEARALVAHEAVDGGDLFKERAGLFSPGNGFPQQQARARLKFFLQKAIEVGHNGNGNGNGHRHHALPAPIETHDQPTEPAWKVLHRIADAAVPEVKASFLAAVAKLVNGKVLREVEKAIAAGDLDAATDAIPWDTVAFTKLGATLTEQLQSIATDAGIAAEKIQPPALDLAFDRTNPLAAKWASERSGELIKGLSDESRAAVRGYISDALDKGIAIPDVADQLRDVIGLTERDANAVASMRATLTGDETLNPLEVDRQVSNYADDLLDGRATNVARQETMMAANRGQELLWDQATEAGLLDAATKRGWGGTPDERECPQCSAMDGVEIGLDEQWQTENGPVSTPQEIHTLCRCYEYLVTTGGE